MKKNISPNYFLQLLCCFTVLIFNSCKKDDFLNEVNPNQQTSENFWKTLDDANSGLTAVYNRFKDQNIYSTDLNNWSDLTFPGFGSRASTTNELYLGTFTNSSRTSTNLWSGLYSGIFRANQVIAGMKNVQYTNTVANQNRAKSILGQAYFFRGLFYFYLYNTFNKGSVPIKDENNLYTLNVKLSSATIVREFYLKDLDSAYTNLPNNWRTSPADLGRATKGAAAAIIGQSYLYEKDYTKAAAYFLDVIINPNYGSSSGYKLVNNIGDNFNVAGEINDESILEICYSKNFLKDQSGGSDLGVSTNLARNIACANAGGFRTIIPAAWLEFAYREDIIDSSDARNKFDATRYRTYSQRLANSIACSQDTSTITYGVKQPLIINYSAKETSYFKKFTNWETPGVVSEDRVLNQSGINFRVLRLANVYLMYAECMLKGGIDDAGITDALRYINRIRKRSALQLLGSIGIAEFPTARYDNVNYTAQQLMDIIKFKERPMELCIEGFAERHIDMRRWGNIKDRFTMLSQQPYFFTTSKFLSATGLTLTTFNTTLIKAPSSLPVGYVNEFFQIASAYTPLYDYFPIPALEEAANSDIYK